MRMETTTPRDPWDIPNRTPEQFKKYQHIITDAVAWAHRHNGAPEYLVDDEASTILCASWLLIDPKQWEEQFARSQKIAARFYHDWPTYLRTIAHGISTPDVKTACVKSFPHFDWEKYYGPELGIPTIDKPTRRPAPAVKHKPTHKRGDLWKLNPRWDNIWNSSHKVTQNLFRRTQMPKKLNSFPWCEAGIKSLSKHTGVSERQTRRALKQLERYGLIKRIKRGYKDQGVSRYLVFTTPAMSAAYSAKSYEAKKHRTLKK